MYKNIIVVTSVVFAPPSAFTSEERYKQLENTIDSIYKHIPYPYIILVEGSNVEENHFKNLHIHKLIMVSLDDTDKSHGELKLIQTVFLSNVIDNITSSNDIYTVNKISGRYSFCPEFSFNVNFAVKLRVKTWSGFGVCDTRYYRFPSIYLSEFREKLKSISEIRIDIEHSFFKHEVLPISEDFIEMKLDVHGYMAPTGEYVRD